MVTCMTIAGSDSGGGAGVQADLKTFNDLGVFGTSAITCITAQNPNEVTAVESVSPEMVRGQIQTVASYYSLSSVKTGMLYSSDIICSVSAALKECKIEKLIVDPVMVATSGAVLLKEDAIEALRNEIMTMASVITPNLHEASILCGYEVTTLDDMKRAAKDISDSYNAACLVKGGHLPGEQAIDILYSEGEVHSFELPREKSENTHGTGCRLSAGISAYLALGEPLTEAVRLSKQYVQQLLTSTL